jgi:hypothetical protein
VGSRGDRSPNVTGHEAPIRSVAGFGVRAPARFLGAFGGFADAAGHRERVQRQLAGRGERISAAVELLDGCAVVAMRESARSEVVGDRVLRRCIAASYPIDDPLLVVVARHEPERQRLQLGLREQSMQLVHAQWVARLEHVLARGLLDAEVRKALFAQARGPQLSDEPAVRESLSGGGAIHHGW